MYRSVSRVRNHFFNLIIFESSYYQQHPRLPAGQARSTAGCGGGRGGARATAWLQLPPWPERLAAAWDGSLHPARVMAHNLAITGGPYEEGGGDTDVWGIGYEQGDEYGGSSRSGGERGHRPGLVAPST